MTMIENYYSPPSLIPENPPAPPPEDARGNNGGDTTTATTGSSNIRSLAHCLFEQQHHKIDEMEHQIETKFHELRRKSMFLEKKAPNFRPTHARVFLTHHCHPQEPQPYDDNNETSTTTNRNTKWILQIEGKLIVDHLDVKAAKELDAAVARKQKLQNPQQDSSTTSLLRSSDKEPGEISPDSSLKFTHLFERVEVEFTTLTMPKQQQQHSNSMSPVKKSKKSSRRSSSTGVDKVDIPAVVVVDPSTFRSSNHVSMEWKCQHTEDADAFHIQYQQEQSNNEKDDDDDSLTYGVMARLRLYPQQYTKEGQPDSSMLYHVTSKLQPFFPNHLQPEEPITDKEPSFENEVFIPPHGLTMGEVIHAFFIYAQDHQLNQESVVHCDSKLQTVFGVDQFPFSELESLLVQQNLLVPAQKAPIRLSYLMRAETALVPPSSEVANALGPSAPLPSLLQFDMDARVPNYSSARVRDILRRHKQRELEYVMGRTQAKYGLVTRRARDEDQIKTMIDRASLSEHSLDLLSVHHAICRGAPVGSEAQRIHEVDMRITYLQDQLIERLQCARDSWETYYSIVNG